MNENTIEKIKGWEAIITLLQKDIKELLANHQPDASQKRTRKKWTTEDYKELWDAYLEHVEKVGDTTLLTNARSKSGKLTEILKSLSTNFNYKEAAIALILREMRARNEMGKSPILPPLKRGKPFTWNAENKKKLKQLYEEGHSTMTISVLMDMRYMTVSVKLKEMKNGGELNE